MQKKDEKPNKIDERTVVPVSFLIVIIGGVSWLSTLHSQVNINTKELEKLNCTIEGCLRYELKKYGEQLARIEGKLDGKKVIDP